MIPELLEPKLSLLSEEYVLVQAWKKTSSYIRYHNWYSDTLDLDRTAVNLPRFLADLADKLKNPEQWVNDPLRIVPAPKSQQWRVDSVTGCWGPVEKGETAAKLRPLAHVSLKDQVAATAVMMCLADRVETLQGDPRDPISSVDTRNQVISYGNRLFCDASNGKLHHRWGAGKLYRAYFQDYRTFLSRPEVVAESLPSADGARIVVVHLDLRQFYDRVSPELLSNKIHSLKQPQDDIEFFDFADRLYNWRWDKKDSEEVAGYAKQSELLDFSRVALPQGLIAAGFLANVALIDLDQALRMSISQEIDPGIRIEDICRYVDDLRIVLTVDTEINLKSIEIQSTAWLQNLLHQHANGLSPNVKKTRAAAFRGDERPLVQQSRKMERIQGAISGGFDAIGGEEILDAVQGLIRAQQRYTEQRTKNQGWTLVPIPDVRDETVARFAAGRFRSTFRSLRPLLVDSDEALKQRGLDDHENRGSRFRHARCQAELDDEARAFALGLVENWVEDPSNVRLLRIGLDLWPATDVLEGVLALLRPFTEKGGRRKAPRRVAWYCLAEIFRAGATETGIVEDQESLPACIDIEAYREVLRNEAARLVLLPAATLPWYLRQQVLLFLAVSDPKSAPILRTGNCSETSHYREMIRFLRGEGDGLTGADFATLAILSRRSYCGKTMALDLIGRIKTRRVEQIAERDPSFAIEILSLRPEIYKEISPRLRDDLCLNLTTDNEGFVSLAKIVLKGESNYLLRNEYSILQFALKFLEQCPFAKDWEVITPSDVHLNVSSDNGIAEINDLKIVSSRVSPAGSMYRPPKWCARGDSWRFQLGYLLRFILAARVDFTKTVQATHWKESTSAYRPPESHWYQRQYGFFNGQAAFGDDWLPISDWTERLLSALLYWPGCNSSEMTKWIRRGYEATRQNIESRHKYLQTKRGSSSGILMLPLVAPWPIKQSASRSLRACIMQTIIPTPDDFKAGDLTCSDPKTRKRHSNHLSTALAAIERMLDLRETHKGCDGRLDWLILPELSVHPRDVKRHLVPFARTHKTIILAGLTYEELFSGQPLINSAIWVIPELSAAHGLQILVRRQGKFHLAPDEELLNAAGIKVQGFRPCQWLVGYNWSGKKTSKPLWLTASICYDATDLSLVADLRHHSDVFAIPAYNKDVTTFDQMALALHYHMFQMVIVANNGLYGGSNRSQIICDDESGSSR